MQLFPVEGALSQDSPHWTTSPYCSHSTSPSLYSIPVWILSWIHICTSILAGVFGCSEIRTSAQLPGHEGHCPQLKTVLSSWGGREHANVSTCVMWPYEWLTTSAGKVVFAGSACLASGIALMWCMSIQQAITANPPTHAHTHTYTLQRRGVEGFILQAETVADEDSANNLIAEMQ